MSDCYLPDKQRSTPDILACHQGDRDGDDQNDESQYGYEERVGEAGHLEKVLSDQL